MAMTMTQKILAAHAGLPEVSAGQLIQAELNIVLGNDITTPVAVNEFKKAGFDGIYDKDKVVIVLDHFVPNKDIKAAEQSKTCREFACEHCVSHFYDVGKMGIEHALLPEQGIVTAGDCIIGADSHTCTYGALGAFSTGVGSTDMAAGMATGQAWFKVPSAIRFYLTGALKPNVSGKDVILTIIGRIGVDGALYKSMEFAGPGVASLTMDDRLCICNMAIEAGAKNGIFPVDDRTLEYLKGRAEREPVIYTADEDAPYEKTVEIDLSAIEPTVACPHLPGQGAGGHSNRPGGHRLLHQRTHGGYGDGLPHSEGQAGCQGGALHHHSGHHGHLPGVHCSGIHYRLYRCRRGGLHPHLRPLPGRLYGNPGRGRALCCHYQPEFCGADGPCQE